MRYLISVPVAFVALILVLLLMAQLIQPKANHSDLIKNLTPIDFFRAPVTNNHRKTKPNNTLDEVQQKEASEPKPPATQALALPQHTPIIKSEKINLPKAQLSTPSSLQHLKFDASPQLSPTPQPTNTQAPNLTSDFSAQFTENLFPLHTPNPMYPRRARKRNIEGWVTTGFTILPDGSVSNVQIIASEPAGIFDSITRQTVTKWKYKPQLLNGKATARKVETTIQFNLQQ